MSLEAFHNLPYYEYPTCISVADIFCLTLLTCLTIVHADCQIVGGLTTEVRMPGKHSIRSVAGILFCLLVLAAESLFGQSGSSGLVTGVVTDPSGAAIVGATVTLQQQGTGATQTAHTDADGRYVFPSVNPANYTLTFAAQGFATTVVQVLKVEVLKSSTVNMTLQIGTNTQTITVSEASAAVELQTTKIGRASCRERVKDTVETQT